MSSVGCACAEGAQRSAPSATQSNRTSPSLGFVRHKSLDLCERPAMHPAAGLGLLADLRPFADVGQGVAEGWQGVCCPRRWGQRERDARHGAAAADDCADGGSAPAIVAAVPPPLLRPPMSPPHIRTAPPTTQPPAESRRIPQLSSARRDSFAAGAFVPCAFASPAPFRAFRAPDALHTHHDVPLRNVAYSDQVCDTMTILRGDRAWVTSSFRLCRRRPTWVSAG
jgi:hypothetical protein